jgi:hypothetical protein
MNAGTACGAVPLAGKPCQNSRQARITRLQFALILPQFSETKMAGTTAIKR